MLQMVVVAPEGWNPEDDSEPVVRSQAVLRQLIQASARVGIRAEALMTVAPEPMAEIARVAKLHRCEAVLLGLSEISAEAHETTLEPLLGKLDADVVVLRAGREWQLEKSKKILVPVAGRGGHEYLLARLLASLVRTGKREVTFLRVLPSDATRDERRRVEKELGRIAGDRVREVCNVEIVTSDDAAGAVAERAAQMDLVILGIQRVGRRKKLYGRFTLQIARRTNCPLLLLIYIHLCPAGLLQLMAIFLNCRNLIWTGSISRAIKRRDGSDWQQPSLGDVDQADLRSGPIVLSRVWRPDESRGVPRTAGTRA